ncbi:MAG: hypothetical protein J7K64_09305, partial [Bacteroidales bacterium]|nr:hypothetical protein [Bacteroidales bacterium]
MQRYKIKHFNPISIIFALLISFLFSCNITKNIPENEKLLVKNKVEITNKHFNEKKSGFNESDIKQILKP